MAGSGRDNITFGQPFNEELNKRVISSCALDVDLEQFPDGDKQRLENEESTFQAYRSCVLQRVF